MAQLIASDGTATEFPPANGTYSLKELQQAVGGYIEIAHTTTESFVFCEDGLSLEMPENPVASARFGRRLVGTVVIMSHAEFSGSMQSDDGE